jgi:hypothetical protein
MDDVQIPQVASTNGPDWHFFGRPDGRNNIQNDSYYQQPYQGASLRQPNNAIPQLAVRNVSVTSSEPPRVEEVPQVQYASYISKDMVGGGAATSPGVPVFVLKSGMLLAVGNYTYQDGRINYELASGGTGVVSTDEVDWTTTTRLNAQRGVRVTLRAGHPTTTPGL